MAASRAVDLRFGQCHAPGMRRLGQELRLQALPADEGVAGQRDHRGRRQRHPRRAPPAYLQRAVAPHCAPARARHQERHLAVVPQQVADALGRDQGPARQLGHPPSPRRLCRHSRGRQGVLVRPAASRIFVFTHHSAATRRTSRICTTLSRRFSPRCPTSLPT